METQTRSENFYVRKPVTGLYFRADDPERHEIAMSLAGFEFFSEPGAYPRYYEWCVVPFRGHDPKGVDRVGEFVPCLIGFVTRNAYGQVTSDGLGQCLSYDPTEERFSRMVFAVRDEDVPITERHKDVSDRRHFVFDI